MDRGFKGIWIPREIWLSKDLKVMEKLFLVEIDSLDNDKGCFASNEYFATFFDISKSRASEIITSLKNKGYITISYKYKENSKQIEQRILKVTNKHFGIRFSEEGVFDIPNGVFEKPKDNNTINNKNNNTIKKKEPRHKYGEYKNILLTDKELEKLISDYGKPIIDEYIKKMDEWIELNGKRYKNYNLALRKWLGNANIKPTKKETSNSVNQFTDFIPDNVKNVVDDELERIKRLRG